MSDQTEQPSIQATETSSFEVEKLKISSEVAAFAEHAAALKRQIDPVVQEILEIKNSMEDSRNAVTTAINTITDSGNTFEALKTDAKNKFDGLQNEQNNLKSKIDEINQSHEAIRTFHAKLFVGIKDDNGNVLTPSMQSSIEDLNQKITEQFTEIESKQASITAEFQALHETLTAEIRSLLPEAGAAGLAGTYYDAKKRYVSFFKAFFHHILFIVPLILIIDIFIGKIFFPPLPAEIDKLGGEIFFYRLLNATPLALISWFGFMSIQFNRQLFEVYNHKQRVMQLYHSFKEEIDTEGTEPEKQKLLDIMLEVVEEKPPKTIPSQNGFWNFLSNLLGKRDRQKTVE